MTHVVDIARSWVGTPYVHSASVNGAGCDCLGLIRGIWRELYGAEPTNVPAYTPDWDEIAGQEVLWQAAERHLIPTEGDLKLGQVILFRMHRRAVAKHLGIVSVVQSELRFIHAYCGHGVVESPLSAPWQRRIAAQFEFGEV